MQFRLTRRRAPRWRASQRARGDGAPRRTIDVDFEYRYRPELSFFVAARNITNAPSNHHEVYGDGTPEYARINQYWEHGVSYVFGIKGTF